MGVPFRRSTDFLFRKSRIRCISVYQSSVSIDRSAVSGALWLFSSDDPGVSLFGGRSVRICSVLTILDGPFESVAFTFGYR